MSTEFKTFDHGNDQIDLTHLRDRGLPIIQVKPTELHIRRNGATDDTPSFATISDGSGVVTINQISLNMLREGMAELGFEITSK